MTSDALSPSQQGLARQALDLHQGGDLARACAIYRDLLSVHPDNADILSLLGMAECQGGHLAAGVEWLDRSLALDPRQPQAHFNRGNALRGLGRLDEAVASYGLAIDLKPDYVGAHIGRGLALSALGHAAQALTCFDAALALNPNHGPAHFQRGVTLTALGRTDDAVKAYDAALAEVPSFPEALNNRGLALKKQGRHEEALTSFDRASALRPRDAEIENNRGNTLSAMNRFDAAIASYSRAIALNPDYAEAYSNRGNAVRDAGRPQEALADYDRALALRPDYAEAWRNRGNALMDMDRLEEAVASLDRAAALTPDLELLAGHRVEARMRLSDWHGLDEALAQLTAQIAAGVPASTPFLVQTVSDSPDLHRRIAERFASIHAPERRTLPPAGAYAAHGKIRVGYFSSDFRDHPVSHLVAGLFEHHDRQAFEINVFAFGPDSSDGWRSRIRNAADRFIDVAQLSDRDVAERARRLEIDIAIDLNGFTKGCRTGIFAERAAPAQLSHIGYAGTMAAPYFDYLVADPILIPPDRQRFYSEKIAYLPAYQVNDDKRTISARLFSRTELGLPETGFVFCSFNQAYKITPETFDGWMRILRQAPDSVLWLAVRDARAARNLQARAETRGVAAGRLIFAGRLPRLEDHLSRHRAADLFLDSHPYNAMVTGSNALRAGLPLLTRLGASFPARMGASLLHAAGLPELIAETAEAYEAMAVELATHPDRMRAIRQKLADNLPTCALFDTAGATRSLEALYRAIHARVQKGLPPDHIMA